MMDRTGGWFLAGIAVMAVAGAPSARADGFVVRAAGGEVFQGMQAQVDVFLDNDVEAVQGWSYGLCHDPDRLRFASARTGGDTADLLGGAELFYDAIEVYPGGVTHAVIVCASCPTALPVAEGLLDLSVVYDVPGLDPGDPDPVVTEVRPCHEELGEPPTRAVYVVGGVSTAAERIAGQVTIRKEGARFDVRAADAEVAEGAVAEVPILIDTNLDRVEAWSYGLCHDPARLEPVAGETGGDTAALHGGSLFYDRIDVGPDGVTRAVIICSGCSERLPAGDGWEDAVITYRARALEPGDPDEVATEVRPCHEELDEPPTRAVYSIGGRSTPAGLVTGSVTIRRVEAFFQFRAGTAGTEERGTADLPVFIDAEIGGVEAWSYGLCHDVDRLEVLSAATGSDTATVAGGGPPWFEQTNVEAAGVTHAVIICAECEDTLPPSTGFEDLVVTYRAGTLDPGDPDEVPAVVAPCHEAIGDPPARAVYVREGQSLEAGLVEGAVTIRRLPLRFRYFGAEENLLQVLPSTGDEAFSLLVPIFLGEEREPGEDPSEVQAFSAGLAYPSDRLEIAEILPGAALQATNGGAGPDFFHEAVLADCFHGEAVISMEPPSDVLIPAEDGVPDTEILVARVGAAAPFYQGISGPETATLTFTDACDEPPVRNVVVVAGLSYPPAMEPIEITVVPIVQVPFVRGDGNIDGRVDVADAVWILNELFQGGEVATCRFAKDANADLLVDSSDAVYLINFLFLEGPPPPAPFPGCGVVEGQTMEDCEAFDRCP